MREREASVALDDSALTRHLNWFVELGLSDVSSKEFEKSQTGLAEQNKEQAIKLNKCRDSHMALDFGFD
jgi:hypothetical protein